MTMDDGSFTLPMVEHRLLLVQLVDLTDADAVAAAAGLAGWDDDLREEVRAHREAGDCRFLLMGAMRHPDRDQNIWGTQFLSEGGDDDLAGGVLLTLGCAEDLPLHGLGGICSVEVYDPEVLEQLAEIGLQRGLTHLPRPKSRSEQ
jgi:hypothetical protein